MKVLFNPKQFTNISYNGALNNKFQVSYGSPLGLETSPFNNNDKAGASSASNTASLISFQGFPCATNAFELKRVRDITCPCCGQQMPTSRQQDAFARRVKDKTGEELQNELIKGFRYYRENEAELVNILIETSEQYPNLDLQGLCKVQAALNKENLEEIQKEILNEMSNSLEGLNKYDKEKVKNVINSAYKSIEHSNDDNHFKTNRLVRKIKKIVSSSRDPKNEAFIKLDKMANSMPNSYTSKDAFFIKYQRKTPEEIANRLYTPATTSVEHVQPQSKGGPDNSANYILMCQECNHNRGNMSYNEWFEIHPEMRENLQTYLEQVSFIIKSNYFPGAKKYKGYEKEVIEMFKKATNGALVLKYPNDISDKAGENSSESDAEFMRPTPENRRKQMEVEVDYIMNSIRIKREMLNRFKDNEEFKRLNTYVAERKKLGQIRQDTKDCTTMLSTDNAELRLLKKKGLGGEKMAQKLGALRSLQAKINEERSRFNALKAECEAQKRKVSRLRYDVELPEDVSSKISASRDAEQEIISLRREVASINKKKKEKRKQLRAAQEAGSTRFIKGYEDVIDLYDKQVSEMSSKISALQQKVLPKDEMAQLTKRRKELTDMVNAAYATDRIAEQEAKLNEIWQEYAESFE